MPKYKITERKITDYTPDMANANEGSERGLAMLEDSLAQDGAGRSIVADAHDRIPAGNKTLEAAVNTGIEDVIEVETDGNALIVHKRRDWNLDDPQGAARRYAYRDNRTSEVSLTWNVEQLLADLNAGVDLSAMWREDELAELLASIVPADEPPGDPGAAIDRAEALREQYGVERGQLWTLGRHKILCGDAYSADDLARLLDGKTADMLHIDPPYGISIVQPSKGGSTAAIGGAKPFGKTGAPGNRAIPDRAVGATGETQRKGAAAVAERNSRNVERGHVRRGAPSRNQISKSHNEYLVIKGDSGAVGGMQANRANMLPGAKAQNTIIQSNYYPQIEGDDRPFDPAYFLDHAPIVIMWGANYFADKLPTRACWICWDKREDITRNNFADGELAWTNMDSPMRIFHHLWNGLHKGSQHGQARTHPTEKPVALFEEIGKLFCDGGLWLDLFAGTGAQLVAAERTGATCYAMEIEPLYVATILDRLERMGLEPERV